MTKRTRRRFRVSGLSPGQSQLDRAVHHQGAGECAHDSRPHFAGNVGRHQRPLPLGDPLRSGRADFQRAAPLLRRHQVRQPPLFRRDRRHPAARRRLGLSEDRLVARAGGNDGAAGGRAVPSLLETPLLSGGRRQSPVDGRAEVRGRLRGLPPPISLADRAGEGGGDADSASQASALDSIQHDGIAVGPARHQRQRAGNLRQRSRAADGQSAGRPAV